MSAWLCIPSARPPEEAERVLSKWRKEGYKIALWRDDSTPGIIKRPEDRMPADIVMGGPYPGYAQAVNRVVAAVMQCEPDAEWLIAAGDDVEPDLNHTADEIAAQLKDHFSRVRPLVNAVWPFEAVKTFGVCQPTGDRWGEDQMHMGKRGSAYIDRVCGSAWIGREFARRVNQGNGPLWPEYFHMGVDEELQHVALKYGVLWQRPDLIHLHQHWGRKRGFSSDMPAFLAKANSSAEWEKYKALFHQRQAAGFPGSELL